MISRVIQGNTDLFQCEHQITRNPATLDREVLPYTHLAKGHPEGWNDAEMATVFAFYDFIRQGKKPGTDKAKTGTTR